MKQKRFVFRANEWDRHLIDLLAIHLNRSRSDAVRMVIHQAALPLIAKPESSTSNKDKGAEFISNPFEDW